MSNVGDKVRFKHDEVELLSDHVGIVEEVDGDEIFVSWDGGVPHVKQGGIGITVEEGGTWVDEEDVTVIGRAK